MATLKEINKERLPRALTGKWKEKEEAIGIKDERS